MTLRLAWQNLLGGHGYATVGEKLKSALARAGALSCANWATDWDALIVVQPPRYGYLVGPGKRPDIVFHTMTEAEYVPPAWVDLINRTGLLWVPSRFCERVFRAHGVHIPIMRTGYGVEGVPVRRVPNAEQPFRVLAWADTFFSRKHIEWAIEVFIAADLPNAVLEVKLNLGEIHIPETGWTDASGRDHQNIRIIHANWSRERLMSWFYSGDVGLYMSGGEGYGLMPKEMMATGLPMITVINTGMLDYLREDMVLFVPAVGMQDSIPLNCTYRASGIQEYVPDRHIAVEHLRWAEGNRDKLADLGIRGARWVFTDTWESIGYDAYRQLHAHYGRVEVE